MDQFLPHYLTYDFKIDDTAKYDWTMLFGLIDWKFSWKNITYLQPTFDMNDFRMTFNTFLPNIQDGVKMIKLDFPGIEMWELRADQHTNILFLPQDSRVVLRLSHIDLKINFQLELNDQGFFDPTIYTSELQLGDSMYYHKDPW